MACPTCLNDCCVRPCVEELLCAMDCCGCCHVPILLGENLDIPAGTILGQRTADLKFVPFDPLAVDGSQLPRGIAQYHVQTDAEGQRDQSLLRLPRPGTGLWSQVYQHVRLRYLPHPGHHWRPGVSCVGRLGATY